MDQIEALTRMLLANPWHPNDAGLARKHAETLHDLWTRMKSMPQTTRKPVKVVWHDNCHSKHCTKADQYVLRVEALSRLAVAEATLAAKSQTALSHFIAIFKELEELLGFHFEELEEDS
jgi:hypothetical protein